MDRREFLHRIVIRGLTLGVVVTVGLGSVGCQAAAPAPTSAPAKAPAAAPTKAPAAPAAKKAPTEIRAGFFVESKPTMYGKGAALFEKATGTKWTWQEFGSGRDMITGFAAGSLDFSFAIGSAPTAMGISSGAPVEVIAVVDDIGPAEELVVRKASGITKLSDLKGKKLATPFGSTSHFRVMGLLKELGLTTKDVQVIDMKPADQVAAWLRGDIDAAYVWYPHLGKMHEAGGEYIETYKDLNSKGWVISDLIDVRTDFAAQYPDTVVAVLKAWDQVMSDYNSKLDAVAEVVAKEAGIKPEEAKAEMARYKFLNLEEAAQSTWLGTPEKPGEFGAVLKRTADFLVEQKIIKEALPVDAYTKAINVKLLAEARKK